VAELDGRRWLYLALVLSTTAAATARLWAILRIDGIDDLEIALLVLFGILFTWTASAFWLACVGAHVCWRGAARTPLARPMPGEPIRSRTAIVMPIHNEEVARSFAGLAAVHESVEASSALGEFDFYILSDSTDPAHWVAEEIEWDRLRRAAGPEARLFYRHRPRNIGRKTGNIRDFCTNWGGLYDYMVVLDADSLMTGETLVTLARLMDANPRTALIQVSPQPVGRDSLFARIQQFASSVYGPIYTAGLAHLQGPDGNYWGHNAIIRVQPFMQHCGLPALPGRAPLGGEILSHDFVEAALLRRAGWDVRLAPELGGSYEEVPSNLIDYLKRDRRWCQGNLQHMRLLLAQGLRMPSRLHFAVGIMSYVSSPLWLAMLVVSAFEAYRLEHSGAVTYIGKYPVLAWPISHTLALIALVLVTAGLLYGPKLLALALLGRDRERRRAHGGIGKAAYSVFLESLFATLLAPVTMLTHSWFVATILLGGSTSWGGQPRGDRRLSVGAALGAFGPHTIFGLAATALAYLYIPGSFWWFVPLLAGLALAVPMAWVTSSAAAGRWLRRRGRFLVPSETVGLPILERMRARLAERPAEETGEAEIDALLRRALTDPYVSRLHLALLGDVPEAPADPEKLPALVDAARRGDIATFTRQDWTALLSDANSLSALAPERAEALRTRER
jgi:membrane glycosyltransferase